MDLRAALDARIARGEPALAPTEAPASAGPVLGREVGVPIGIAASYLTRTPAGVRYFAERGFDVLTAKTVRSRAWTGHGGPGWIHLDDHAGPLAVAEGDRDAGARAPAHGSPTTTVDGRRAFSDANSLGVPSPAPEEWQRDLAASLAAIGPRQLLVASVQGTPEACADEAELVADFVTVAQLAAEAGASAIELNLSCPNVLAAWGGTAPPLCASGELVAEVVAAVRHGLDADVRLVAKLSSLPRRALAALVDPLAEHCDAVSGINTLPVRVLDHAGAPVFCGVDADGRSSVRPVAGLSGVALRDLARTFVADLVELRGGRELEIIAMGGVMGPEDVRALLALGADAVQSVTAAAHDPLLAARTARVLADAS